MIRRIVSMVTSRGSVGSERACVPLPLRSLAAGERAGDLVDGVLCGALGVVDATFVLQATVAGQRAGGFLHATFRLIDVLVGRKLEFVDSTAVALLVNTHDAADQKATC